MEETRKSNKISDIVKLKQMLKKWKTQANHKRHYIDANVNANANTNANANANTSKGISFLKRTLSFTDVSSSISTGVPPTHVTAVPKGFLAVHVGPEMKRFVIPTKYLSHCAFWKLLKEAEEEFGFQQEGVLKIPCEVGVFESIVKSVEAKNNNNDDNKNNNGGSVCGSLESQIPQAHNQHQPQSPMCR